MSIHISNLKLYILKKSQQQDCRNVYILYFVGKYKPSYDIPRQDECDDQKSTDYEAAKIQ